MGYRAELILSRVYKIIVCDLVDIRNNKNAIRNNSGQRYSNCILDSHYDLLFGKNKKAYKLIINKISKYFPVKLYKKGRQAANGVDLYN